MPRLLPSLLLLAALCGGFGWWMTAPQPLPPEATAGLSGDAVKGEAVFWAAGCASCHMAPEASGAAQRVLSGGQRFTTAFGTFIAPNISPDPQQGIGGWSLAQFANAVQRGISPEGDHLYPAFPYAAYAKMAMQDLADLKAFMDTLPPDPTPSMAHEVGFPFNIRRALGGWKLLFLTEGWGVTGDLTAQEERGRYLAEALAHCGECHTPRNALGGLQTTRWLAGAPNPSGKGTIPNLTPAKLDWSEADIAAYLTTGFTPEFDSVGGHMAHVVENFARLPESEAQAVAAYLKKVNPSE
ncbi:Cytochrome c, mono-and diheme variants [Gemmobacter aquatilis]|uniref:Cytochrome c, mono-and diheme variants n=1 Tax=Gemmobacter aquatilis TaxID=933059 RepID=A0A1H8GL10_9RHOB|nr:cytochrome c [Gemmobacter aquatilis]SEN44500.1 Cytochrome c, mono-and diheme variants [Gemmobacter aquatilis]